MSVFVVAEAGSNWYAGENGPWTRGDEHGVSSGHISGEGYRRRLMRAMELIECAAAAGVDACKFQLFRADDLYPKDSEHWHTVKPLEMPLEWLPILSAECQNRGIEFMCSAFSEAMVDAVDPWVKRHKIASLEATDKSLIRHVVSKGKPIILSTGALDSAQMHDLRFEEMPSGNGTALGMDYSRVVPTTLMHCTTAYPCPPDEANLLALYFHDEMGRDCDGLSDHTLDPVVAPVLAVALGATVIEKHFTLSRQLVGPDHAYAITPPELSELVRCVRLAERMLGDGVKRVQNSELVWRKFQHQDGGLRGEGK